MENSKDPICHKCGKPATGRYSPDKEVAGLAFCDKHKELMAAAFYCLIIMIRKLLINLWEQIWLLKNKFVYLRINKK